MIKNATYLSGMLSFCFVGQSPIDKGSRVGEAGSFALLWLRAVGRAAMQMCLTVRMKLQIVLPQIATNVYVCDVAGGESDEVDHLNPEQIDQGIRSKLTTYIRSKLTTLVRSN